MSTPDRKLLVFLCHASQDKSIVRELYRQLLGEGWIDPWLDEEKILPGQDWDLEIEKAVEASDAVIVFLSKRSVTKEGYIQKEIRKVLDMSYQKPEGTIFIIPLRLDECEPPRRLSVWQYLDFFPIDQQAEAYTRLLSSLKLRSERLIEAAYQGVKVEDDWSRNLFEDDLHFLWNWYTFGVVIHIESLEHFAQKKELTKIRRIIPDLKRNAREMTAQLRSLYLLSRNKSFAETGLRDGIEHLIAALNIRAEFEYKIKHPLPILLECPNELELPSLVRMVLLRIASEALSNAIIHSGLIQGNDTKVNVLVEASPGVVTLTVNDNGWGAVEIKSGFGIERMRDLVRQMNSLGRGVSELVIDSTPGKGTQVQVHINF